MATRDPVVMPLVEFKARRATPLTTAAATAAMVTSCRRLSATANNLEQFPTSSSSDHQAPPRNASATASCLLTTCWTIPQVSAGNSNNKSYNRSSRNNVAWSASRYTRNDWVNYNKASQSKSSREAAAAELTRSEAWTAARVTEQRTKINQRDATRKLGERVRDIDYWRAQLTEEAQWSRAETQNLAEHLRVLEDALASTSKPLNISEECLLHREKRTGIDLVRDEVERQLMREVDCIRKCQRQMQKITEKAREQLKLNEAALHELEKDLSNKRHARRIDGKAGQLENQSPGIDFHPGVEKLDSCLSIQDSWARFSQENIRQSRRCRTASERLRAAIGDAVRSCGNEMYSQFNAVNAAFGVRIKEVVDARSGLQAQLQRTVSEILDAERTLAVLGQAIADKAAPLKVAETRLLERSRRLEMEFCSDAPMNALQREVCELRDSIRSLEARMRAVESTLARLMKSRTQLEAEIRVKENSLRIDSKRCMPMRKIFSFGFKEMKLATWTQS